MSFPRSKAAQRECITCIALSLRHWRGILKTRKLENGLAAHAPTCCQLSRIPSAGVQDKAGTSPRHHSLVLYGSPGLLRLDGVPRPVPPLGPDQLEAQASVATSSAGASSSPPERPAGERARQSALRSGAWNGAWLASRARRCSLG